MKEHIFSNQNKINSDVLRFSIAPVIYFLLIIVAKMDTFNKVYQIQEYHRGVGVTAVSNYDINRYVQNVYIDMCIIIPIICIVIWGIAGVIISKILKKYGNENEPLNLLNFTSVVAAIAVFIEVASKYGTEKSISEIYIFVLYILIAGYLYILFNKNKIINIDGLKWFIVMVGACTMFVQIVLERFSVQVSIHIPLLISCFFIAILDCLLIIPLEIKNTTSIFAFWSGAIAIMLEGIMILNQREIYVTRIYLAIIILTMLFLFFSYILLRLNVKIDRSECINYGIIFSVTMWTGLPLVQSIVETDLFEQANYAVSFSQLALAGKIPIVESVSAHLASDWIPNVLYYILNNDYLGALFSPYQNSCFIIWIFLFYIVLKQCIKKDYALVVCLLLPFVSNEMGWGGLALIPLIGLIQVGKQETYSNFFLFWLLIALGVIYKADTGIALGIACVLSYFIVKLLKKEKIPWYKGCVTFALIVILFSSVFIIICMIKDIEVFERILEFINIFGGSNEIWAYGNLGTKGNFEFAFVYFGMPLFVVILLLLLSLRIKMQIGNIEKMYLLITYTFGIAYLINIQRILVRHNYLEIGFSIRLVFTAAIFISLFFVGINKKNNNYLLATILSIFMVIFSFDDTMIQTSSLLSSSHERFDDGKIIATYGFDEKTDRVIVNQHMEGVYDKVVERINSLLDDDETFFDFSNQSLLYSLSKRISPVYIVQSPSQIASENGQDYFLKEIMEAKTPIAISTIDNTLACGTGVDGMLHSYRFYKVSEYLNNNYCPIETIGSFVVWVEKERFDLIEKIRLDYEYVQFTDEMEAYDMDYNIEEDSVMLIGMGMDPHLESIYIDTSKIETDTYSLSMLYEANNPCDMKVYYKDDKNDEFCEEQSLIKGISYNGHVEFELPKDAQWIRVDIPQDVTLSLSQVCYNEKGQALTGMYYGDEGNLHNYNLGQIPYLWANFDYKNATSNSVVKVWGDANERKFDVSINDKENVYVKLVLSSNSSCSVSVKLAKGFRENASFNFVANEGEHTYLIRVSADSYWDSVYTDTVVFQSGEECQLVSVELISVEDKMVR